MAGPAVNLFRLAALAAALSLAACDQQETELANLDNQIVGNDADPALTSALQDQILVDPALTQQSNKNAVRPPETPTQAQYPLPPDQPPPKRSVAAATSKAAAAPPVRTASVPAAASGETADCAEVLDRNPSWARRLPSGFGLYPGARLNEAAGTDRADCRARIVTYRAAAAPEAVLEWYRGRAAAAGYSAERQMRQGDHILAGANGRTGSAYYLILTPLQGGGSEVALIVNGG
jgi:hypothetical protein